MTGEESEALLLQRWAALEEVVRHYGGDPAQDLVRAVDATKARERLIVYVRIRSAEWTEPDGRRGHDTYWFKLDFVDYDDHAPRISVCNPNDYRSGANGKAFYPKIANNGVFSHDNFLCMPGDRRCYDDAGNHPEWRRKEHYHPDIVVLSLFELIRAPGYERRKVA